jgi:NADPH:quinone reductase-like Zn-dependent oxidoreductase
MKAYELQNSFGLENLKHVERPEPRITGPGDVLLKVRSVSLNYRDLMTVGGAYNPKQPFPLTPCSDAVGEVIEVGSEVTRFEVGDRVSPIFCQGWIAGEPTREKLRSSLGGPLQGTLVERMLLDQAGLVRVPEYLSDEEAATLPCAAVTAWNAVVVQGSLGPRGTVLIQGGGGVSLFVLQIAKAVGARVFAISGSEEKLDRLNKLGADEVLLRKPGWGGQVKTLTRGDGVDLIVEVGGAESLTESLQAVRIGGTIVLVGVTSGGIARIRLASIFMRHVRMQGIVVGSREMFEEMLQVLERHRILPVIDRVFEFDKVSEAFRYFSQGRQFGKVCIRCS